MRILVTGGSGFIGLPIIEMLEETNHEVLAFSRIPGRLNTTHCKWIEADIDNPAEYEQIIFDYKPEVLLHLAWRGIPDFSLETCQRNLFASQKLIDTVIAAGACKKVIVSGSCFEYNIKQGVAVESNFGTPRDHFTWAKLSLLSWVKTICDSKNINWAWLRIFYAYGPRQRAASLVPTLIKTLSDKQIPNISTPFNENDFVYVSDVASGFVSAINQDYKSGIFNLGLGKAATIIEVCRIADECINGSQLIADALAVKASSKPMNLEVSFWADNTRSKDELKWKPLVNLREGIRLSYEWYLSQSLK
jgi:nucleoside-diphosphate-sugar epimerase